MMTEKFRYNGSEIIDQKLAYLLPIFDGTSIITIIFTLLLITIIITKTPTTMKTYKTYLLPYAFYTLLFELSFGLYSPRILHPYFHFYPAGIARFLPTKISKSLLIFGFYCSMSLYDCCIAMTIERYYAMTNLTKIPSKIPFFIFCALSGASLIYLFIMMAIILYAPLETILLIPEVSVEKYLSSIFDDLDQLINTKTVLAFTNSPKNAFSPLCFATATLLAIRVLIALGALLLTEKASRNLKTKISINPFLSKYNSMLLRMINLQFFGVTVFLFLPVMNKFYAAFFLKNPSNIVNYTFVIMNFFGLYDTIITVFFIKPYRHVIILFAKKYLCFGCLKSDTKIQVLNNGYTSQQQASTEVAKKPNNDKDVYFVGK